MEPIKEIVDTWLIEDSHLPRKQRHTATHIFNRLRNEYSFAGGLRTVSYYVSNRRKEKKPHTHPTHLYFPKEIWYFFNLSNKTLLMLPTRFYNIFNLKTYFFLLTSAHKSLNILYIPIRSPTQFATFIKIPIIIILININATVLNMSSICYPLSPNISVFSRKTMPLIYKHLQISFWSNSSINYSFISDNILLD